MVGCMKKQGKKDKKDESKAMKMHPDKAQDVALIKKMVKKKDLKKKK